MNEFTTKMDEWLYDSLYWIERILNCINKSIKNEMVYDIRLNLQTFEIPNEKNYKIIPNTSSRLTMYEHIGLFSCWLHIEANILRMSYKEQLRQPYPTRYGY